MIVMDLKSARKYIACAGFDLKWLPSPSPRTSSTLSRNVSSMSLARFLSTSDSGLCSLSRV